MFYRDRPVREVAWAWLCGAVSIEPFEVSLWRGGCGVLWDFNQAGSLVQSRRGGSEGVCRQTSMRLGLGAQCSVWREGR